MEKPVANVWHDFFADWPSDFLRRGVVISSYQEQIPFNDFVISSDVIILERPTPDAVGGRRVALPFARIEAVKYTDPMKTQQLLAAGFQGAPVKASAPRAPVRS